MNLVAAYLLIALSSSWALPPFKNMYEGKYGYKVNCTLCHVQDDWELNSYGVELLRRGLDNAALESLEKIDVDKDGRLTKDEIAAKSNPGDPASVPGKIGSWLQTITPVKPPVKTLMEAFPDAGIFSVEERTLTPDETRRINGSTSAVASDVEKFAVVFIAKGTADVMGGAAYAWISEKTSKGVRLHVFLVSANPNGRIIHVSVVRALRKDLKSSEFLSKFKEAWPDQLDKVDFPKSVEPALARTMREAIAKAARLVDLMITP